MWDVPPSARALEQLGEHFRVINFDRRGTGHSDRLPLDSLPTWEDWADDLLAVMNAAGSQQAAVHGARDGGIMALLFAAHHPERVTALSLGNCTARYLVAPDYPEGLDTEQAEFILKLLRTSWGTPELSRRFSPVYDDHAAAMSARMLRGAATPQQAAAYFRYLFDLDIRAVLPTISVPTLVEHRATNTILPVSHGRYIARHIPGARFEELPGSEATSLFGAQDGDDTVSRLVEFITGTAPAEDLSRALVTLVFCDIVNSTEHTVRLEDEGWNAMLERFYAILRTELQRHGGREVDRAGDGMFMAFDRPTRALRCALALQQAVRPLGLQLRCGVHSGECSTAGNRLSGMAVNVGARIAALAQPGEVWLSNTVRALTMGSGLEVDCRGEHELRGLPERWSLFALRG
jgi:class 3 adenylate cyclase